MQYENEHFSETIDEIIQAGFKRFQADNIQKAKSKASDQLDFEEAYSSIKTSRQRTPFVWITVNPKPNTSVEDLKLVCDSTFSTYLSWYVYAFEIRKAPDQGLHVHCLGQIYESRQNGNFSRIKNPFMSFCGNLKHIDIKYVDSGEIENVYSYLQKSKVAKSKKQGNDATKKWRTDNNIDPLYIEGDLPTCLVPEPLLNHGLIQLN